VPPNIWFAFKGVGEGINMLTNIADISHDPNEVLRKELNEIQFSDK
jgi:dTDP-4-dehydrorhamnose 3,5-epimerase